MLLSKMIPYIKIVLPFILCTVQCTYISVSCENPYYKSLYNDLILMKVNNRL